MAEVLIVANQTLCSDELIAAVLVRNAAGDATFHIAVPATPLTRSEQALRHSEHLGLVFGESGPVAIARMRLRQALALLADANVEATGDVGDPDPLKAVLTAVEHRSVDEVIVSTLPRRLSRWIAGDLPRRLRRAVEVPVRHVEAGSAAPRPRSAHVAERSAPRAETQRR